MTCDGNTVTVKNGDPGKDGKSAFDIAKEKDPDLTVDEWLTSLKSQGCSATEVENGVQITCDNGEPVTIKNGDPGKDGKSAFEIAKEKNPNLTVDEWLASLKGQGCTAKEVEDGVEITCGNEDPVKVMNGKEVEVLNPACQALRASTDKFNSMYDVFYCLRSNEKVAFILRHAQRNKNDYQSYHGLNDAGRAQAKQVGEKLKALQLGNFYYMYTDVKRNAETAKIIAVNKGEKIENPEITDDWHEKNIEIIDESSNEKTQISEVNNDLKEGWYATGESTTNCKADNVSGWSVYSKIAYKEFGNSSIQSSCEKAFYDIDEKVKELTDKYFTYDKMHKYTLAISHDQFLVPFVVSVSKRAIMDEHGHDLRFHKYDYNTSPYDQEPNKSERYNHWINYLTGVAIITDPSGATTIIPVKALESGILHTYE